MANGDPCLHALFFWFTQESEGEKMPGTERIRIKPLRLLGRLRRRPDLHRVTRTRVPGPGCFRDRPGPAQCGDSMAGQVDHANVGQSVECQLHPEGGEKETNTFSVTSIRLASRWLLT